MKYEKPIFKLLTLEANDIITLSRSDVYDPEITDPDGENPWG